VLHLGLDLGLVYVAATIAALLATGPWWRRGLAVLVVAAAVPVSFHVPPEYPTFRALLALGALWGTARIVELVRERGHVPTGRRVWHALGIVDSLRARRIAPRVDLSALSRMLLCGPLVVAGWAGVYYSSQLHSGVARLAARWGAGVVFLYSAVEIVVSAVILLYGLIGVDPRPIHEDPIRAKTITEFWSRRWNRVVHRFLKRHIFAPMARRGHTELGMVLAFVLSGFLHFAFMLPAVGLSWALVMGAFFLVQLPLLWAERWLGVARWGALPSRAWTLGLLLASSPLFIEPVLQIVDTWS
jgi:hypothetical protein